MRSSKTLAGEDGPQAQKITAQAEQIAACQLHELTDRKTFFCGSEEDSSSTRFISEKICVES